MTVIETMSDEQTQYRTLRELHELVLQCQQQTSNPNFLKLLCRVELRVLFYLLQFHLMRLSVPDLRYLHSRNLMCRRHLETH